jgi:hypothetical protein
LTGDDQPFLWVTAVADGDVWRWEWTRMADDGVGAYARSRVAYATEDEALAHGEAVLAGMWLAQQDPPADGDRVPCTRCFNWTDKADGICRACRARR